MPDLRVRFDPSIGRTTISFVRYQPDDLEDPPVQPQAVDPCLVEQDDYDLEEIDIYGLDEVDEDDD